MHQSWFDCWWMIRFDSIRFDLISDLIWFFCLFVYRIVDFWFYDIQYMTVTIEEMKSFFRICVLNDRIECEMRCISWKVLKVIKKSSFLITQLHAVLVSHGTEVFCMYLIFHGFQFMLKIFFLCIALASRNVIACGSIDGTK